MSCCSEECPLRATFDTAQLILINFEELSVKWLRMYLDNKEWQTLHNTACNGPVCTVLVNGDHVWSGIYCMNDLIHMVAEVRNRGLRNQVIAGRAL